MKYIAIIIILLCFQVGYGQSVTELKNINPELGKEYEILQVHISEDEELLRFINYDSTSSYKEELENLGFFETEGEIAYLKSALDTIKVTSGINKILQDIPKQWIDIHRYRKGFYYYSHRENIFRQRKFEDGYIKIQYMDGLYLVKIVDAVVKNDKILLQTVAYDYNGAFRRGTLEIAEVEENSSVYYWKGNYEREYEEVYLMTPIEVVRHYPVLIQLYWADFNDGGPGFQDFTTRIYLDRFK